MRQKALKPIGSLSVDLGQSALPSGAKSWHRKPSGAFRWALFKYTQLLDTRTPLWGGLNAYEQTRGLQHFDSLICFILDLMVNWECDGAAWWNLTFPSPSKNISWGVRPEESWGERSPEDSDGSKGSSVSSIGHTGPHTVPRLTVLWFRFSFYWLLPLCDFSASMKWPGALSEDTSYFCKTKASHPALWLRCCCCFHTKLG